MYLTLFNLEKVVFETSVKTNIAPTKAAKTKKMKHGAPPILKQTARLVHPPLFQKKIKPLPSPASNKLVESHNIP